MRISDWSSDVCSSDLVRGARRADGGGRAAISARAPADRLGDTGHGVPRRGGGDRRGDGDTVAARLVGGLEARGAASPGGAGSGHSRIGPLSGGRSFVLYGTGRATFTARERDAPCTNNSAWRSNHPPMT